MIIADLNVPHSPSTVNDGPPSSRRKAITPTKWISSRRDFIQAWLGFNPSKTDFIATSPFLISHFSFLILFLRRKNKKSPATYAKNIHHKGRKNNLRGTTQFQQKKSALHFTLRSTSDSNKRICFPENQKRKTP